MKLSINVIRKITFFSSLIIVIIGLIKIFAISLDADVLYFLEIIFNVLICIAFVLMFISILKQDSFSDEMAEANEGKAAKFSIAVTSLIVLIGGLIIKYSRVDTEIALNILFMIPFILWLIKDGLYLYLEKLGN